MRFTGWPAWIPWSVVHIYFLAGSRSRRVSAVDWIRTNLTHERGSVKFPIAKLNDETHGHRLAIELPG